MKLCPAYPQLYFIVTHSLTISDALHDLVPFVQFKRRKNTQVTLLHGCFSRFLNCTNDTKSCKAAHVYSMINMIKVIVVFQVLFVIFGHERIISDVSGLLETFMNFTVHHLRHYSTLRESENTSPIHLFIQKVICYII